MSGLNHDVVLYIAAFVPDAAAGTITQSVPHGFGHCPAETSADSGFGAWYLSAVLPTRLYETGENLRTYVTVDYTAGDNTQYT